MEEEGVSAAGRSAFGEWGLGTEGSGFEEWASG